MSLISDTLSLDLIHSPDDPVYTIDTDNDWSESFRFHGWPAPGITMLGAEYPLSFLTIFDLDTHMTKIVASWQDGTTPKQRRQAESRVVTCHAEQSYYYPEDNGFIQEPITWEKEAQFTIHVQCK